MTATAARCACPICETGQAQAFQSVAGRDYWRCPQCLGTFLEPSQRPTPEAERAEYDLHHNDADDPGYRRHLMRLAEPLLARLPPGAAGLDWGCGPTPALAAWLAQAGHPMAVYDPFFAPDAAVLTRRYDFITCTEVAEHFHHPAAEFRRLASLLRPGGWLGLMTRRQTDDARFAGWHYRRDPTHVVFYRADTLHWIARQHGWSCELIGPDIALFQAPLAGSATAAHAAW